MNESTASSITVLMRRGVWTVSMGDTVAQVESFFAEKGLTWAPVLEGGRGSTVVGVISTSDLLHFRTQKRDASTVPVWQLCSYKPIIVEESASVGEVARLMVEHAIHHVVVTNREGISGVVSALDFVRTFVDRSSRSRSP